jgi:hypothetical protein
MYLRYTAAAGISGKEFNSSEDNASRGKMITTADFYDDYGLFMYQYQSVENWATVHATKTPKVVNEQVKKGLSWKTKEYWPGSGARLALYGYAPYNAAGVTNLPTALTTGKPKFSYVVPTEAIDQKDLLVSEDDAFVDITNENGGVDVRGDYNAIKTLKFKHACTAVRIAVGDQMAPCTITKIAIKGVKGEAEYNYGAGSNLNEGAWENYSDDLYDYTLTKDFAVSATDQNKVINDGKYTFMLLPQTVPGDAILEITLDDGEEHILTANIGNSVWEMGYSITYFLTTSSVDDEYVLLVETSNEPILMAGESREFNIKSYKQTFYGSQTSVPWILSCSYEDEQLGNSGWLTKNNDIISVTLFSGNGSNIGETSTIQVAKQIERSKPWRSTHTAVLRNATQQGSAGSPVDLSAGKQTANCYVVSAPGYYTFPLVYGNARNADGSANSIAYNSNSSTFVDHNGVHIDSPYIYETNGGANVPAKAFIVWQDAPHLVTPESVKLSPDKHSIEFQVEKNNICQGNSVIAVCDANGTIMWSWHIWVTDHDMTYTIEVHNNPSLGGSVISDFMEVPLGWCDAEVRVRNARIFNFKVVQSEASGKTATLTFNQLNADSLYTYGNNAPYYQFGRKDPMLPSNGVENFDKFIYDKQRLWTRTNSQVSTGQAIQNPFTFYYVQNGDWSSSHNWDYWNINFTGSAGHNNTETVKTIYDPSVSGFCLPRTAAFTGFTKNGSNTGNYDDYNVNGLFEGGWNFYTIGWKLGGTIFFHALGFRDTFNGRGGNGSISYVSHTGLYNSSGANSSVVNHSFTLESNDILTQGWDGIGGWRSYGGTVWPVKNK